MTANQVVDLMREAIIVSLKLGGPVMAVSLAIGLLVSFFQALTQIQEHTLTFVPKIVGAVAVILLLSSFMLGTLASFTHEIMGRIASG